MSIVRKIVYYTVVLLSVGVIAATLLSLLHDVNVWWIKALDFPRVQCLVAGFGCTLLLVVFTGRWSVVKGLLVAGLVASIALQSYFIVPYTPWVDKALKSATLEEAASVPKVRLLIANVYMHNRQVGNFLTIATNANADLVLVMETNQWWVDALQTLRRQYPYSWVFPAENTYGMALYSVIRLPINRRCFLIRTVCPLSMLLFNYLADNPFAFMEYILYPQYTASTPTIKAKKKLLF